MVNTFLHNEPAGLNKSLCTHIYECSIQPTSMMFQICRAINLYYSCKIFVLLHPVYICLSFDACELYWVHFIFSTCDSMAIKIKQIPSNGYESNVILIKHTNAKYNKTTLFWRVLTMVRCISKDLAFGLYPSSSVFSLKNNVSEAGSASVFR
jgi:hypothetical protein